MTKIVDVPFGTADKDRAILENLKRNLHMVIEFNQVKAEIARKQYLAYDEQGFTPEQAIELCKGAVK